MPDPTPIPGEVLREIAGGDNWCADECGLLDVWIGGVLMTLGADDLAAYTLALKDCLADLMAEQNGPPLIRYTERWNAVFARARRLLGEPPHDRVTGDGD